MNSNRYPSRRAVAKTRGRRGMRPGGIVFLALVAIAIVGGIFIHSWYQSFFSNRITKGVTINGQDVSGRPVNELREQLRKEFSEKLSKISVRLSYQDKSWTLSAQDMGVKENVDEIVDQAAKAARVGDFSQRKKEADKIAADGLPLTIMLSIDSETLQAKLESIADEVNLKGHNASVSFNSEPDGDPLRRTGLSQSQINSMFKVKTESVGYTVDVQAMMQKISADLQDDYKADQQLIVEEFKPTLTAEKLRESFHLVSRFDTEIGGTSERTHNISLALSKVNGTVLSPGEEFSFNKATGERNKENGYQMAHVIGKDKTLVDDWGGGVCQASTTLYNAALMAGCEVTDRAHHSFPSSYVIHGFDAMVNYPTSDLKFKNVSNLPMYIKAWVSDGRAYVLIFGKPLDDGVTIKRESVQLFKGEVPEPKSMVDESGDYSDFVKYTDQKYKVRDSYPELRVQAYLVYKDKHGEEIRRKLLYEDHFNEVVGLTVVGKEPRPANTPQNLSTPRPDKTPDHSPDATEDSPDESPTDEAPVG